jgi:cob(I)alamin adenosyltransferase
MAVHLTRIYTKTGDAGTTALGDGSRVAKTDPHIEAYADVDEANAALGVALALGRLPDEVRTVVMIVQNDLFDVGADLCVPVVEGEQRLRATEEQVARLEGWCDEFNEGLANLRSFILNGGTPGAALLHVARTVTRRAERAAWAAYEQHGETMNVLAVKYLNRLSDLLFILSRGANGAGEVLWSPGKSLRDGDDAPG